MTLVDTTFGNLNYCMYSHSIEAGVEDERYIIHRGVCTGFLVTPNDT